MGRLFAANSHTVLPITDAAVMQTVHTTTLRIKRIDAPTPQPPHSVRITEFVFKMDQPCRHNAQSHNYLLATIEGFHIVVSARMMEQSFVVHSHRVMILNLGTYAGLMLTARWIPGAHIL